MPPDKPSPIVSNIDLRQRITRTISTGKKYTSAELDQLGRTYLQAAEQGDVSRVRVFLETNFPVNYRDKRSGQTAVHVAAACKARDVVRAILERNDCDLLVKDIKGRLPSDMAYLFGGDPALARLLSREERKQATQRNVAILPWQEVTTQH